MSKVFSEFTINGYFTREDMRMIKEFSDELTNKGFNCYEVECTGNFETGLIALELSITKQLPTLVSEARSENS